ncbi:MAG: hypothetical protein ACR2RL_24220 [Gammaproteobacteria bacterium]
MVQFARNVTMGELGFRDGRRYLIHDRDAKFTDAVRATVKSADVEPLERPARSRNPNARGQRWVKSVEKECLS